MLKWGDALVYIVVILLAVFLLMSLPQAVASDGLTAVILIDGQERYSFDAAELMTGGELSVEANGYHYHIIYENGRIRFADADCPDRVCVKTGWLSRSSQVAACVPGHVLIRFIGTDQQTGQTSDDVDVIVK